MQPENPIILLLEDCPVTALLVERTVMTEIPQCRLVWARNVAEATARAEAMPIELFLVDINLPDGNGLDFLSKMSAAHPLARAIVMTANALPEHQANSAALGVLHFLEKPLKLPFLIQHLRRALDSEQMAGANQEFRAVLENVTPADILQLKCLTHASTVVEFHAGGKTGHICFQKGELADAQTGALRGVEAVFEIISWKRGEVTERAAVEQFERTINCSWQTLLMEAAQRIDERAAAA